MSGEEKRRALANDRMRQIQEANIDFSKFGWVQKVADTTQMHPQKVNVWMKRYFPDILQNAFSRRTGSNHVRGTKLNSPQRTRTP